MSARNEWEMLKFNVVTGANANTDITLTGITTTDKIVKIINLTDLADVDPAGLVIAADKFKITASTASKKILVIWADRSQG